MEVEVAVEVAVEGATCLLCLMMLLTACATVEQEVAVAVAVAVAAVISAAHRAPATPSKTLLVHWRWTPTKAARRLDELACWARNERMRSSAETASATTKKATTAE